MYVDLNANFNKNISQCNEEHLRKSPIFKMAEFFRCGRGWPIVFGLAGNGCATVKVGALSHFHKKVNRVG